MRILRDITIIDTTGGRAYFSAGCEIERFGVVTHVGNDDMTNLLGCLFVAESHKTVAAFLTGVIPEHNRQALCDCFEEWLESGETRLDLRQEPLAQSEETEKAEPTIRIKVAALPVEETGTIRVFTSETGELSLPFRLGGNGGNGGNNYNGLLITAEIV